MESARADVLIETIQCLDTGEMPGWSWHAQRLSRSARELGFEAVPADIGQIVEAKIAKALATPTPALAPSGAVALCVQSAPSSAACVAPALRRVRLLYQRDGEISITVAPLAPLVVPAQMAFAHVILGDHAVLDSAEPLLRHKATHRPWYAEATQWLDAHTEYFDLIFFNERGELCEGSRTNVYVNVAGEWLTPALENGCLPGTVRARLLDEQRVRACSINAALLAKAQAWRLSNGLRGWFDVVLAEGSSADAMWAHNQR